ncbi:ABC transporter substrate-binding protein [Paenibacillus sp. N3.4]|uniref:ABC transporter substrate-binding protein n=1 Tax=Paenibacillus sp. N3.4 TaxID=2603222 RepID=UPI0011CA3197|nr:ABC transporter substrate-binding protein [Paenibacillus sp. N3.4]TXK83615.1 ABC transporter substrate-binding protein [Paenibacillus sp. N3.4]
MKKSAIFTLILAISMVFTACSSKSQESAKVEGKAAGPTQLIVAAEQEPVGLDPNKVPAASSKRIYSLIYDSLTTMDGDFTVKPGLADKWGFSPDGKVLTMNLHPGVKFHNGREMTSDDVKYTYERILNPSTGALSKSSFSSIASIETPDKNTVVFKFKTPDTAFLANASSVFASIVPKEVTDLNKEAVGTGPFMLEKMENGQYVLLKKNPNYFNSAQPKVDSIKFQLMKDESERLAALRSGSVDISMVSNESAKLLESAKSVKVINYLSGEYGYFGMNVKKKPFDDPRVRQAISYAMDRNEIANTVYKAQGVPSGPISPALKAYALPVSEFPAYTKNIDKAKQLLKEAGYENGFETAIDTEAMYQDLVDLSQVIQQQLQQIGIKVTINKMEEAAYIAKWKSKDMVTMVGRNSSGTNPDRALRFFFATDGSANVWNYSNKEYDALVQKALETTDDKQRKEIYNQAQKMVVQDAPNVFLASPKIFYAVSNRVQGFNPTAAGEQYAIIQASVSGK